MGRTFASEIWGGGLIFGRTYCFWAGGLIIGIYGFTVFLNFDTGKETKLH